MAKKSAEKRASRAGARKAAAPTDNATGVAEMPQDDPEKKPFTPQTLDKTVIAIPLLDILLKDKGRPEKTHSVIIDLNLQYPEGRDGAREWVMKAIPRIIAEVGVDRSRGHQRIIEERSKYSEQYVFARLEAGVIQELVRRDGEESKQEGAEKKGGGRGRRAAGKEAVPRAIYHIWPDFRIRPLIHQSVSTVKADAARVAFSALGENIVWAVMDSGVDASHPHFKAHDNLALKDPLRHMDFTGGNRALEDAYGHGTHVAGIIAGEQEAGKKGLNAFARQRDRHGEVSHVPLGINRISGMAPMCKILSLKVMDDTGSSVEGEEVDGAASSLIEAISYVQKLNGNGRNLLVHGVNISVGYNFWPKWFACGQSPLCVEIDRLVRSGVVVVVAAGNSGYIPAVDDTQDQSGLIPVQAGAGMTINDPGNAELAITVGSTHRESPHVYGISYFSSKGPTGDGRAKPDLVAPGEKIISCAAGRQRQRVLQNIRSRRCDYVEDSGTSMAAPHVSGVIAAFLSVRREFIGQPEKVKQIFLSSATDLQRERYFQGRGLVDLMRAIQSL